MSTRPFTVTCRSCSEEASYEVSDSGLEWVNCENRACRNFNNKILGPEARQWFEKEKEWFQKRLENGFRDRLLPVIKEGAPYPRFDPFRDKPDWTYWIEFEERVSDSRP